MVWGCSLNLVKQIRVETVGDYLHLAEVQLYDLFHAEVSTVDWLYIAEGLVSVLRCMTNISRLPLLPQSSDRIKGSRASFGGAATTSSIFSGHDGQHH